MKRKYVVWLIACLSFFLGIRFLLTRFDSELATYAPLAAAHESEWASQVEAVNPEQALLRLYADEKNQSVTALQQPNWVLNVAQENRVHALRANGFLYLILHKWKNSSAGICVPIEASALHLEGIEYIPIPHSKWVIWKYNLEKQ